VATLATLPIGCLGGGKLAPPSKGGPPWIELRSERFRVLTDLGRRDAEYRLAELDRVYELLAMATGYGTDSEALETRVFLFRNRDELQQFIPSRSSGMFTDALESPEGTRVPTLLIAATSEDFGRILFAHELAHRFMGRVIGQAPPWLHEGLAQYFSTVHGTPDKLVVGDRDAENVAAAGQPWSVPGYVVYAGERLVASSLPAASRVAAFESKDFYGQEKDGHLSWEETERVKRNYFVSWALVHMLLHEQHDYALEVQRVLATAPVTGGKAGVEIRSIVDQVDADRLNGDFAAYIVKPGHVVQRREAAGKVPPNLEIRDLPEDEILEYWALIEPLRKIRQAPR
jgi:hypothetical protein